MGDYGDYGDRGGRRDYRSNVLISQRAPPSSGHVPCHPVPYRTTQFWRLTNSRYQAISRYR